MDRVKEALFSIIGREIYGANFLDLFAGTGSVGIEALSRGARHAVFVDLERNAIKTIHENLKLTRLEAKATVRRADALAMIKARPPADEYNFIYVAPPQYKGLWLETLQQLDANPAWVPDDETTVIVQIDPKEYQAVTFENLKQYDQRSYGKTMLIFYSGHARMSDEGANNAGT
jgi:16S rRNA (guanine(966)-N(2))-methyltransferase RsmD